MTTPEIRISPDGRDLAIRNRDDPWFPWRVTDGSQRSDSQMTDWQPLRPDAETRLTEVRAQLENLATDVSDGAYHVQQFDNERLADLIREIATEESA